MTLPPERRTAVALAYGAKDAAPRVVAKGYGLLADTIVRTAREHGLYVHESPELVSLLMQVDLDQRIPAIYTVALWAELGGLISYGTDFYAYYKRAATYVDKILKGAKPAELPVLQPTKFELVINLQTAEALRLTIPQLVLAHADELIQ